MPQKHLHEQQNTLQTTTTSNNHAIPQKINKTLQDVLLECDVFSSDNQLRSIFIDDRISLWHNDLPNAIAKKDRVSQTISFLSNKFHVKYQENGLILFLHVIKDHFDPLDVLHHKLIDLAIDLKCIQTAPEAPPPYLYKLWLYQTKTPLISLKLIELNNTPLLVATLKLEHKAHRLLVLDLLTGNELWHYSLDAEIQGEVATTPKYIVFGDRKGFLHILSKQGEIVLKQKLADEGSIRLSTHDNKVYIATSQPIIGHFDITQQNITTQWDFSNSRNNHPITHPIVNDTFLVMGVQHSPYKDKTLLVWNVDKPSLIKDYKINDVRFVTPLYKENIFLVFQDGTIHSLDLLRERNQRLFQAPEKIKHPPLIDQDNLYIVTSQSIIAWSISNQQNLWEFHHPYKFMTAPLKIDTFLYLVDEQGTLIYLNALNGKLKQTFPIAENIVPAVSVTNLVEWKHVLYVGWNQHLYVIKPIIEDKV